MPKYIDLTPLLEKVLPTSRMQRPEDAVQMVDHLRKNREKFQKLLREAVPHAQRVGQEQE